MLEADVLSQLQHALLVMGCSCKATLTKGISLFSTFQNFNFVVFNSYNNIYMLSL